MTYTPIERGTSDWDVPVNAAFTEQDSRITANESAITANTDDITALEAADSQHSIDITALQGDVATNTADIATNVADIATNTADIATNTADIATNTSDIATNASDIATHESEITVLQGQINPAAVQGFIAWNYDSETQEGGNLLTLGTVFLHKIYIPAGAVISNLGMNVTTAGSTLTYARAGLYDADGNQLGISVDQTSLWNSTGFKVNELDTPVNISTAGFYYVAQLNTGTTGATMSSSPGTSNAFNANTSGATLRHAAGPTGQSSLPASITMSSNISTGASIWVAVY